MLSHISYFPWRAVKSEDTRTVRRSCTLLTEQFKWLIFVYKCLLTDKNLYLKFEVLTEVLLKIFMWIYLWKCNRNGKASCTTKVIWRFEVLTVGSKLWSSGMWHCIHWQMGRNVSEEPAASIFRDEDDGSRILQNNGSCLWYSMMTSILRRLANYLFSLRSIHKMSIV